MTASEINIRQIRERQRTERGAMEWEKTLSKFQPYRYTLALRLALLSATLMTGIMLVASISPETNRLVEGFHTWYVFGSNILLFLLLYGFVFWSISLGVKQNRFIFAVLPATFVLALAFTVCNCYVERMVYGNAFGNFKITLVININATLIADLICLLLFNVTRRHLVVLENEHLQAENLRISHETLEQHVSPHFLFNSLNTLDGLIGIDDTKAHTYLLHLASTFRYTLQDKHIVTLSEELEFTHAYIYLLQIRYGDALKVEERIDSRLLYCQMPAISLQLLVENVIKHNVITNRCPMIITIETTDHQTIRVSNPLQPKSERDEATGTGLGNLGQRYLILFRQQIDVRADEQTFVVEIPLI